MKKIIVIGASAASVAFISKLRSFDQESQIICFSGEPSLPYNRCFLADFLTGEQTQEQLQLKPQDFFEKNNVDLRLNSWVCKIDPENKKVTVADDFFDFDYLFLGMGCRPFVPNFLQGDQPLGVFTFHTLSDMQKIKNFIDQEQPQFAVVIGAGLNGIEAVSSLIDLKMNVTVVEAASAILPGQVDLELAAWLTGRINQAGVQVITGHKVVAVDQKNNRICSATLDDGTIVSTQMIIIAAGSVVNSDLVQDVDVVTMNGSIVVDDRLKTNFDYVFAAGDVCAVSDMVSKKLTRSATWSDAMLQGLCAATNLSATARTYPGIVGLRDSYFFGLDFYACGQTVGHDDSVQVIDQSDGLTIKKFYLKNDRLVGFVFMGDISKLAEYKMWYMTQKAVNSLIF